MYISIIWMKSYYYIGSTIDQAPQNSYCSEGIQTTLKDIKEFIASRSEEQQLKETKNTKQSHGHLVSYNPFNQAAIRYICIKKI